VHHDRDASDASFLKALKPRRAVALYEGWSGSDPASPIGVRERDEKAIRERPLEAPRWPCVLVGTPCQACAAQ
jgi:hypothetical protein